MSDTEMECIDSLSLRTLPRIPSLTHSPQGTVTVPESYQQAMKLPEGEIWKEAAQKEN